MSRRLLTLFCAPVAVAFIATAAAACGSVEEEQPPESQLFATDPFGLESGLAIVEMTHQGEGDFAVALLSATQEETTVTQEPIEFSNEQDGGSHTEVASALADASRPGTFTQAAHIPVGGKHLLQVKADGPWKIKVEQPRPSSASRITSFSGDGNTATPFFELSGGIKTITTTTFGGGFKVSLLDKDGKVANNPKLDEGKREAGPGRESAWITSDFSEGGIYLFNVQADGLWTIEISDGEQPVDDVQPRGIELLGVPLSLLIGVVVVPVAIGIVLLWGLKRSRVRG
jgi:hypothetical protein